MPLDTQFLQSLADIVGEEHVRGQNAVAMLDPGVDPSNFAAGLAVRPSSAAEVAAILSLCDATGVPVISHGGRTGLAGGAVSAPGELVLMTDRLDELTIDPVGRVAIVGAGISLQSLQEACAAEGLSPGIDLGARGSATVGGMVSTNAGGMEAFRYGMMRQRLLGMEAVLADGTVLCDLALVPKNNEGYDLRQLFCGAEGTLGVVTRVTMKLERADPPSVTMLAACPNARTAIRAMRNIEDRGGMLRAEIMWRDYARVVAEHTGLSRVLEFCDAAVYLIIETALDLDGLGEALSPSLDAGDVIDAVIAQSGREAADIWGIREDTFAASWSLPHQLWFDISLPLACLDTYMASLRARLDTLAPSLVLFGLGHLADGNLHLTICRKCSFERELRDGISQAVEHGVKDLGGSMSAEHGIGTAKLAILERNASAEKLAVMRRLKAALDPNGILNPGKVVPAAR
ncbi:MAG: FAD-binding oxidoreductase [Pseudomonadota bacterium]